MSLRLTPAAAMRSLKRALYRPGQLNERAEKRIVEQFHRLYYGARKRTWENTFWLGIPTAKCPLDLWIYQEIIQETKPERIIECGTASGGSALFLASICELAQRGQVISVDIQELPNRPAHERIKYLTGSSVSEEIVTEVKSLIKTGERVMAILDSDHTQAHVLQELKIYGEMVTVGNFLIVEDTNVNGYPVRPLYGNGPMEAVEAFLQTHTNFIVEQEREKFFMTFNPRGYLRKVK